MNRLVIFGGVYARADTKHYTSLQRFWIESDFEPNLDEIEKYLKHVVDHARIWNSGCLSKYHKWYGLDQMSGYSALSILRHFGGPTPIMDWSENPFVSLFFAAFNSPVYATSQSLENFFSLYRLSNDHPTVVMDYKVIVDSQITNVLSQANRQLEKVEKLIE